MNYRVKTRLWASLAIGPFLSCNSGHGVDVGKFFEVKLVSLIIPEDRFSLAGEKQKNYRVRRLEHA